MKTYVSDAVELFYLFDAKGWFEKQAERQKCRGEYRNP